ncbi:MAG: tetratricopeptide repeat protein [Sedimentisphaerales bacterium]|nr:tetratricopeptide repeat protein [Sedimentisphaerales bacterium]
MTEEEIKESGQNLFKAGQYSDAIPLLKSAVEAFPEDECLWQELVLAAHYNEHYEQAVEFAKQAIRKHPRSGWFWRELGDELTRIDRLDEAEKALNNARSLLGHNDEWLWRYLAALHQKRKNAGLNFRISLEKEIEALEYLCELGEATSTDLNQLGNAYYNHKNFAKALEQYRLSVETEPSVYPLFNMGLVFNDPEVSQDADAADAYRRALVIEPDYERAKEMLDITKRKLVPLAERARTAVVGLVRSNDMFHFYISPFEALQIEPVDLGEDLDVKSIQRGKRRLLQEIELNDGKVSWIDDYPLDKARGLAMEDELLDETKRRYHWAILQNKRLLRFLTHGDIEHFLYSDDYFPHETLELLDDEPEFRAFLSKPFARQYNLVLTRAIEQRLLPVIEVLFDGRRWVEPEDVDVCLEGAFKRIGDLVELMRSKAAEGCAHKVSLQEIEDFLEEHSFPELFNLLPTNFASAQGKVVTELLQLGISCFNEYDDADLSKGILNICKRFTSRSVEVTTRLEKNFKTIEEIISEQQRHQESYCVGTQYEPNWVFVKERDHIPSSKSSSERIVAEQRNQESFNKSNLWWLVIPTIFIIIWVINSFDSTKTAPSGGSSESKTVYRVPSSINAELNRDALAIERERTVLKQMDNQLEYLSREIEREDPLVDTTNQFEVDKFNRKVERYNTMLEKARAQNRKLNQMIDSYNKKLQKHGR